MEAVKCGRKVTHTSGERGAVVHSYFSVFSKGHGCAWVQVKGEPGINSQCAKVKIKTLFSRCFCCYERLKCCDLWLHISAAFYWITSHRQKTTWPTSTRNNKGKKKKQLRSFTFCSLLLVSRKKSRGRHWKRSRWFFS